MNTSVPTQRPRVVILGGGFAGVGAARKLKDAAVDVVLVDAHNYHTFQPLLYQVATGLLETSAVGHPLRDLFRRQANATVRQATVAGIDLAKREVRFAELAPLPYDCLVLALGARVTFFGIEGAAQHAFPLYTLVDAVRLKEHLLLRWAAADRDPALVDDGALNVVVVGGGPTGVESAGALIELYRADLAKDYPLIRNGQARVTLVEASPELFTMFKPHLRKYTKQALETLGVQVLLGESVAAITPTRVTLRSGAVLAAHTVVWGAGLQAHPLTTSLGLELQKGNRIVVGPDLSVAGHPEVFAAGDIAWITDMRTNVVLPQLGSVALQSGEHAGQTIARRIAGEPPKSFAYGDRGSMAAIGRGHAVVQMLRGRTITGKAAVLAWGAVHLALLPSGEDRIKALVSWIWAAFTHDRTARIIMTEAPPSEPASVASQAGDRVLSAADRRYPQATSRTGAGQAAPESTR
jgi:NADH dehydrogenase